MAEIPIALIKQLRDKTNAGMMDCKGALKEAAGDMEEAETILRKRGIARAGKKASRSASEGVISSCIHAEGRVGALTEINCETDFVAKNENFQSFVKDVTEHVAHKAQGETVEAVSKEAFGDGGETVGDLVKTKIAELGENMVFRRFARYSLPEGTEGVVASYIHLQGKVGVLLEVRCSKPDTAQNDVFRELVKDITLHIAAAQPICVSREEVCPKLVEKEKEIFRDQVKGKPENIIEKIDKFYGTVALLEQGFVKDPDQSISIGDLIKAKSAEIEDDGIAVTRFTRFAVGEEVAGEAAEE